MINKKYIFASLVVFANSAIIFAQEEQVAVEALKNQVATLAAAVVTVVEGVQVDEEEAINALLDEDSVLVANADKEAISAE